MLTGCGPGLAWVPLMSWREALGDAIGTCWAPWIYGVARLRHGRMFHPEGLVFRGRVDQCFGGPFAAIGRRLGSHVLARFSGALWKHGRERFDVLGIALRFSHVSVDTARPHAGDQDLLFATILSPLAMPLAPLMTHSHDFFANRYYAVAPFELVDRRRVKFRLTALEHPAHVGSRGQQLRSAVAVGAARFELAARATLTRRWHPVAHVALEADFELDQDELRFDPFRDGAEIVPVGFVHAIRRRAYAASQAVRAH